jgi:hypothetical protein
MGETRKTTDFWGPEKEEHFNDSGDKVGETRFSTDWKGDRVQQHVDAHGNKTGETRGGSDWLGRDRAEHTDTDGNLVGTSRDETDWLGRSVQRHYDPSDEKVGETRHKTDWIGSPYKDHEGEYFKTHPSDRSKGGGASSPGYDSSAQGSTGSEQSTRSLGWIVWVLVIPVLLAIAWFVLPREASVTDATQVERDLVPSAIRHVLDTQYPGWSFPDISPEDKRECPQSNSQFFPGLVWGDFIGDGRRDYGVAIQRANQRLTLAFLSRGDRYKEFILSPAGWKMLDVVGKGSTVPVFPEGSNAEAGSRVLKKDALIGVGCQTSAVAFTYVDGEFRPFYMSD